MSILNIKKNLSLGAIVNSILYTVVGGLFVSGIWFVWFLYNNFYTTISRAETVLILKSELAVDVLDVPLYEKIKKMIEQKSTEHTAEAGTFTSSTFPNLPNPFIPQP